MCFLHHSHVTFVELYVFTVYPRWEGQVAYKMKTTSPKDYTIKLAPKDVLNCAKKPLPFISVSLRPASGSIRMGEFHDVSPRHVCRGHEERIRKAERWEMNCHHRIVRGKLCKNHQKKEGPALAIATLQQCPMNI